MTENGIVTAERGSTVRSSNLELLRIFCILAIISDHFVGQSGVVEGTTLGLRFFYCALNSLSRVGASVFIIISAWFSVDKPFRMKKNCACMADGSYVYHSDDTVSLSGWHCNERKFNAGVFADRGKSALVCGILYGSQTAVADI